MRRTTAPLLAAALGLVILSGCSPSPEHLDGDAVPVGAATTVPASATPAPTSAKPTPPTPAGTTSSGGASPPATNGTPALVLGPTGLGALKIGMTVAQAKATGMIAGYRNADPGCGGSHLKNATDASVIHSPAKGVVYIPAYGKISTPAGIRLGSTLTQVKKAYPNLRPSVADGSLAGGSGRAWATATSTVNYRFMFTKSKVTELALEHDDQDCYE